MQIQIAELTAHPERLNADTLYGLRQIVARYPYYQAARILFMQNLFVLHDSSFGDELQKAALYVPDRQVLFDMVEGDNYDIKPQALEAPDDDNTAEGTDRTASLIDRFLVSEGLAATPTPRRAPTPLDATTDYAAYLLQMDDIAPQQQEPAPETNTSRSEQLIDGYIAQGNERPKLEENPQYTPDIPDEDIETDAEEDYFTETLAKIYIKQGRYEKAMEIIRKIHLNYPKKNRYFADQMRFLQKLIINQKSNTK